MQALKGERETFREADAKWRGLACREGERGWTEDETATRCHLGPILWPKQLFGAWGTFAASFSLWLVFTSRFVDTERGPCAAAITAKPK